MAQQPMTFPAALKMMLARDASLAKQKTQITSSRASYLKALGNFLPSLQLQASQQFTNAAGVLTDAGVQSSGSDLTYSGTATLNVFRDGADVAGLSAADRDLSYQRETYVSSSMSAEKTCAEALFNFIEKSKDQQIYQTAELNEKTDYKIARARYRKSLLSKQELDKVAIDLATAQAQVADAQAQTEEAKAALGKWLGSLTVQAQWPWSKEFSSNMVTRFLDMKSGFKALEMRPDYQAAMELVRERKQLARRAGLKLLPTVDLSYSRNEQKFSTGQTASGWTAMATLSFNLFSGFSDYANYKIADQSLLRAKYNRDELTRQITSQQQAAKSNFRLAVKQYSERNAILKTANDILKVDMGRFKMGRADANEIKLDVDRVTTSQVLAVQGEHEVHSAYLDLLHAFGKMAAPAR